MNKALPYISAFVLVGLAALSLGAVGLYPARFEEMIIGGGSGDTVDGGADFEKDGDIVTTGDITANSFDGTYAGDVPATQITGSITDAQVSDTLTASKLVMASGSTSDSVDIGEINATGTPGITNYLRGDGVWSVVEATIFKGTGSTSNDIDIPEINATGTPGATTFLRGDGTWSSLTGTGDVVGPASAADNAVARFDSTTGKLLQSSSVLIDDNGNVIIDANDRYFKVRNAADTADVSVIGLTSADNTLINTANLIYFRIVSNDVARVQSNGLYVQDGHYLGLYPSGGSYAVLQSASALTATRSVTWGDYSGEVSVIGQTVEVAEIGATGTAEAGKFLQGDGTWAIPAGSGDVAGPATSTINAFPLWADAVGGSLKDSLWTSSNVPRLDNADTISADWVNTANPWADNEVSDTLTSSIFVGSGSTSNAVDLATAEVDGVLPRANTAARTIYWFSGQGGFPLTDPGADMDVAITTDGTPYTPFDKDDELTFGVPIPSDFDGSVETIKLYWQIPTATEAITWSVSCTVLADSAADNTAEATPTSFTAATPDAADDVDIISVSDSDILGSSSNAGAYARVIIKATDADGFANEPRFMGIVMEY